MHWGGGCFEPVHFSPPGVPNIVTRGGNLYSKCAVEFDWLLLQDLRLINLTLSRWDNLPFCCASLAFQSMQRQPRIDSWCYIQDVNDEPLVTHSMPDFILLQNLFEWWWCWWWYWCWWWCCWWRRRRWWCWLHLDNDVRSVMTYVKWLLQLSKAFCRILPLALWQLFAFPPPSCFKAI